VGLLQRRTARADDILHGEIATLAAENAQLRDEVTRVQGALDSLPIGIVLVDADGSERVRNTAASHLGGGTHADVLVLEAIDKHVRRALEGDQSSATVDLYGPPMRVVQIHAIPSSGGGALVTVEDISERARLDAVRTDFVANISHELKTPVGALAVLAEMLVDEEDPGTIRRLAAKAVVEAHRAATAIDDLMELSRIELGGQAVREPVDAADVLREGRERAASSAERRGITVRLELPEDDLAVLGDRRQLVSAVGNLVDNAVKYSEPGGEVTLSVRRDDGFVELIVADLGIGIPARDLDRIFERFYRVDRARSRDTGGTGLGLAIVRHVAANHEGEVRVQSTEGEGSTFTLRIPVAP
jgi:two-component system, OmpR family, sensor histidine kinase SenX3